MCNSVQPHRRKPTRLPRPWDSPGKNTGVGCHFLLQCMKVKSEREVAQSCPTLSDPMDCSLPACSIHGIFQARVLEWGAIAFSTKPTRQSTKLQKWSYTFAGPILISVLFACAIADLQAIWTSEPLLLPFFTPRPNCFFPTLSDILVSWPPPCSWPH